MNVVISRQSRLSQGKEMIILLIFKYIWVFNCKNKYIMYKNLYIDKNTAKPIKMEIQDVNQKLLVYILYNEIKIDSTSKEEILAFHLKTEEIDI